MIDGCCSESRRSDERTVPAPVLCLCLRVFKARLLSFLQASGWRDSPGLQDGNKHVVCTSRQSCKGMCRPLTVDRHADARSGSAERACLRTNHGTHVPCNLPPAAWLAKGSHVIIIVCVSSRDLRHSLAPNTRWTTRGRRQWSADGLDNETRRRRPACRLPGACCLLQQPW